MNIKKIIRMTAGTFCMAAATNTVFEPLEIVTGGLGGFGIVLKYYWNIPLWVSNAVLNVPLFFIARKRESRAFFWQTLSGAVLFSLFLGIVPAFPFSISDFYVKLVFGTVLMGAGLGLVFMEQASTGGTDLAAILLKKHFGYLSVPVILGILDGMIVAVGAFAFGIDKACYALLVIYGVTKVSDAFLDGFGRAKMVFIFCENQEQVRLRLLKEMHWRITKMKFPEKEYGVNEKMLLCIAEKKEVPKIKEIAGREDENALVIVINVKETMGTEF